MAVIGGFRSDVSITRQSRVSRKTVVRDYSFGVVWAERLKNIAGITVIDSVRSSQLACNVCLRKIKNLCELLEFISKRLGSEQLTADLR